MSDTRNIDERLGELLRRELPIPDHTEGYRERVAALLTAEGVSRTERRRWRSVWAWLATKAGEKTVVARKVPRRPPRSHRPALVATLVLLLVIVAAMGSLESLEKLFRPTMVLRITDETIIDVQDPAATRTTIVATSLASLDETKDLIREFIGAINANQTTAVGKLYATNGWLDNAFDGTSIQGSTAVANYWREAHDRLGLRLETAGDPVPYDRYIAQPVRYLLPNEAGAGTGVFVFQIDTNGQIAHVWITGWMGQ